MVILGILPCRWHFRHAPDSLKKLPLPSSSGALSFRFKMIPLLLTTAFPPHLAWIGAQKLPLRRVGGMAESGARVWGGGGWGRPDIWTDGRLGQAGRTGRGRTWTCCPSINVACGNCPTNTRSSKLQRSPFSLLYLRKTSIWGWNCGAILLIEYLQLEFSSVGPICWFNFEK